MLELLKICHDCSARQLFNECADPLLSMPTSRASQPGAPFHSLHPPIPPSSRDVRQICIRCQQVCAAPVDGRLFEVLNRAGRKRTQGLGLLGFMDQCAHSQFHGRSEAGFSASSQWQHIATLAQTLDVVVVLSASHVFPVFPVFPVCLKFGMERETGQGLVRDPKPFQIEHPHPVKA